MADPRPEQPQREPASGWTGQRLDLPRRPAWMTRLLRDHQLAIVALFLIAAAVSVAPFAVYRLARGEWLVGLSDAAIVLGMTLFLVYAWKTGNVRTTGMVAAAFANAMALLVVVGLGLARDWLYPALIATFLVAPRGLAIALAALAVLIVAAWPDSAQSPVDRLTFVAVAAMVCVFSLVFASGVDRRHLELSREARIDPLTGVGNRRALEVDLAELSDARREAPLGLALLDIDHFKRINDAHGHGAGDRVLEDLGAVLRGNLRRSDGVYRLGGEEFVILLAGTGAADLPEVVSKLHDRIREELRGPDGPVTVSLGATVLSDGEGPGVALERADRAMYEAKRTRDRAVIA